MKANKATTLLACTALMLAAGAAVAQPAPTSQPAAATYPALQKRIVALQEEVAKLRQERTKLMEEISTLRDKLFAFESEAELREQAEGVGAWPRTADDLRKTVVEKVQPGMAAAEVNKLLGRPHHESREGASLVRDYVRMSRNGSHFGYRCWITDGVLTDIREFAGEGPYKR